MPRSAPKIPVSPPIWLHLRPPSPPAPWDAGDGGGRRSQDCWVRRQWEASRRRAATASQRQDWARQRLVGQNPAPFATVGAQNRPNPLADSADSPRAVCQKPSIHRQEGFCRKHELFGGALRKKIRNYANINRATRGENRTAEGFAGFARRGTEAGFDAFKLAPFDHMARNEADPVRYSEGVQRGFGFVRAVREAIGPDRDLLIDGHGRFDAARAIDVARELEPFDLYWMEEMCRQTHDLRQFNDAVEVQTAGGESLWGVEQFFRYIESGAVDTVMPDVKYCGGMYELKKIAAMAEGAGLKCSPHGPASPVGNMAAAHVCATMPNFDILELAYGEVAWREETVVPRERLDAGYLTIPERPGIGYEMNPQHWDRYDG